MASPPHPVAGTGGEEPPALRRQDGWRENRVKFKERARERDGAGFRASEREKKDIYFPVFTPHEAPLE
ncbi:hypothetical protein EYF80_057070 [Liparis tanakae]|uniref:Uncharacterized protein n=1 Tax=Liparis tanakae TaxID=230148 RepID=A0A4Z2EVA8_9TELE|nr:hypothetical protein EYF80_057070 [Liparis tanakae]